MAAAFRELKKRKCQRKILSVKPWQRIFLLRYGRESFSSTADETVEKIRKVLEERSRFFANHFPKKRNAVSAGFTACLF
ncbi:MAG: hypothetical protein ACLUIQ_09935 [Dialister invisus]